MNPVYRNSVGPYVEQPLAPSEPSPIESLAQRVYNFFKEIVEVLKRIFCGCCAKSETKTLADFNNSRVVGQVHGIYITTNETNLSNTRQLLTTQPRPAQETIHIGCATWHNLDIMALRQSTHGLILDFNPKNAQFMNKTVELIDSCESREAFTRAMIQYLDSLTGAERDLFFHPDQQGLPTERIERELEREGSWLHSEESYLYLKREVISKRRLTAITEDMRNSDNFSKIREFLDKKGIVIDTLYLSNICNFMATADERNAFGRSVKVLLQNETIFINCPKIGDNDYALSQRAVLGREVLADSYNLFAQT
jgi:hypothetical protein